MEILPYVPEFVSIDEQWRLRFSEFVEMGYVYNYDIDVYIYTQYNDYVVCIGKTFSPQKVREWGNCLYTILRDNRKVFFFRHKKGTDGFFYKVFDVCFLFFFIVLWLSLYLILYFLKRTYVLYRTLQLHVVRFGVIFLELPFRIVIDRM